MKICGDFFVSVLLSTMIRDMSAAHPLSIFEDKKSGVSTLF